jgi:hypothetical protein
MKVTYVEGEVHRTSRTPANKPSFSRIPQQRFSELPGHDSGKYENERLAIDVATAILLRSQALVYVPTAYSQCPHCETRDEMYPVPLDYQRIFDGKMMDE